MRQMIKYRDYLIERLADPEEAIAYLETSQEEYQKDGDTVAFLLALQSIAEAQVGNNELLSQVYLLSGDVHRARGEYDWAIEDYDTVSKDLLTPRRRLPISKPLKKNTRKMVTLLHFC